MGGRDEGVEAVLERGAVGRVLEVEIEPRALLAHRPAGDAGAGQEAAEKVERSVHAHQAMPPRPVDLGFERGAGRRERRALCGHVEDFLARALHRLRNLGLAAVPTQDAAIAGLAAGAGVEDRAVEHDAAFAGGEHGGLGAGGAGIFEKEALGHAARPSSRRGAGRDSTKGPGVQAGAISPLLRGRR